MNDTSVFVALSVFYIILFGYIGMIPSDITIETTTNATYNLSTISNYIPDASADTNSWTDNFFQNIAGLPSIINLIIFIPLGAIVTFWLVKFIIWVLPFVGGS